ncbi:coproporphyrinogen III oxidase [Cytophagales bacterium WSM2-2]|nr:coproporphyrinogen III oxidase [Cytophagales bacterium WSM2-2]
MQDSKPALVDSICRELDIQQNYLAGEDLETIYLGGGTPSILSEGELAKIFESIRKRFQVIDQVEITLEANPDDLTTAALQMLKEAGVNRLSIGIQSFDDTILKFLNRVHSSEDASRCISHARQAGFHNISIDLIYAIPEQDDGLWKKNVEQAIALSPEHISAYSLTIEEKTVFGNWRKKGKLKASSDEVAATQMEILISMLTAAGYRHYEISNFCKPDFYSRHNSSYWRQKKYLGVGPSAHSFNGESRQFNISNNALYIRSIKEGKVPYELELLSSVSRINEYLLTTLRTDWGCNLQYLESEFGHDVLKVNKKEIENFVSLGFVTLHEQILSLTSKGKFLADKIASDLFVNE